MADKLYFDTLKEDRSWYFVEYRPPIPSYPFATLQLIVPGEVDVVRLAEAMESELVQWLGRYQMAVMISSFDATGDLISLDGVRPYNHLIGWFQSPSGTLASRWGLVANEELPQGTLQPSTLLKIHRDVPYRNSAQLQQASRRLRRVATLRWWLVFAWAVAVPAGLALWEFNGPIGLARLTLGYALLAAYIEALKLLGGGQRRRPASRGNLRTARCVITTIIASEIPRRSND